MNKTKNSFPRKSVRVSVPHRLLLAPRWKERGSANSGVWSRHAEAWMMFKEGKALKNFKPIQEYDCCTQLEKRKECGVRCERFWRSLVIPTPLV